MNPLHELDALAAFIQPFVPETNIHLLHLPKVPESDMLVLRYLDETPQNVNGMHTQHVRRWQVLYFHSHPAKVVSTAYTMGKAFIQGVTIPYTDEEGRMFYVRVRAFNIGQPQENESELTYSLSILETHSKSIRNAEQYELMEEALIDFIRP